MEPKIKFEITDVRFRRASGRTRFDGKTRIYIWPEGESVVDLFNRHSRPYELYRYEVIPQLWDKLCVYKSTKVAWRQYCGCTCPCSPGFIVKDKVLHTPEGYPADLHVSVKMTVVEPEAEAEAA